MINDLISTFMALSPLGRAAAVVGAVAIFGLISWAVWHDLRDWNGPF